MSFPFLLMDDIKDCWKETKETKPNLGEMDNMNNCHFDRSIWNLFDEYSSRTNNTFESYNLQVNGKVTRPDTYVCKILELTKKEESFTSTKFERENQGKEKKILNAQEAKDALLKSE